MASISAIHFMLKSSGNSHREAKKRVKTTRAELKRDVVLARKHKLSVTEIAKKSGHPRTTIYALLGEDAREND